METGRVWSPLCFMVTFVEFQKYSVDSVHGKSRRAILSPLWYIIALMSWGAVIASERWAQNNLRCVLIREITFSKERKNEAHFTGIYRFEVNIDYVVKRNIIFLVIHYLLLNDISIHCNNNINKVMLLKSFGFGLPILHIIVSLFNLNFILKMFSVSLVL